MLAQRTVLSLAKGLLTFLPVVLWAASVPAQQPPYATPYPPPQDDAYRPPARGLGQTYPQGPQEPYYPPGPQTNNGPGQPYGGPPPGSYNQPYYGPQGRYDGPSGPPPGSYDRPYYGQQGRYDGPSGPPPGPYDRPYYGPQGRYDGPNGPPPYRDEYRDNTYSSHEIIQAGHQFFGAVTQGLARVIEYAFQKQGRPNGYILGQDAGGAFVAGLRYGEGTLFTKDAGSYRVYWQGPSIGYDAGGDGSKVMVLVYNLRDPSDIYRRFGGVDGSAYMVGGVGLTFQKNGDLVTAPIRTGVGLRLGANVGYLKYTRAPTWNPF